MANVEGYGGGVIMTDEFEYIKQFIAEHPTPEYFIPEDYVILGKVADTPNYLREYFEWKGEQRAIEALRKIAKAMAKFKSGEEALDAMNKFIGDGHE